MSNKKILDMTSITNSGTLVVMVADPNNASQDSYTTLPTGGGGGGGAYIGLESGTVAVSISAMPTLANPPLAPVFDAVITNDGTTQTNYQRPQGMIIQPAVSGDALGIALEAGASTASGRGGPFKVRSGDTTYAGAASITSFGVDLRGGNVHLSDPAAGATGSYVALAGGNIYGTAGYAYGGFFYSGNATLAGTASAIGATFTIAGGSAGGNDTNVGGGVMILARSAAQQGGGIELYLGLGSAAGGLGIVNLGTGDPHVLNRAFLGVSNGVTLSAG